LDELRRRLRAALLHRVQTPGSGWQLIWLPDSPAQPPEPFKPGQLAELTADDFLITRANFDDPEISGIRLGGQVRRVRVEVRDSLPARPTFDLVKGRVKEALAKGLISWEAFDQMTEEAMRARFHPESKTSRNVVRTVREALRVDRKS